MTRTDESGFGGLEVVVIGTLLVISVLSAAVFVAGRTTAQSTGRDIARSLAEHTSYVCRDYTESAAVNPCPYISETGSAVPGCSDTTAGRTQSVSSWVCEWSGLNDIDIPEEPARLLSLFHSDRTDVRAIRLESDYNARSVRVSVRICSEWMMIPLGRWCGNETVSHHL